MRRPSTAYRRLLASSATSNLADGVLRAALPLMALRYTDASVTIAAVSTVGALPWLLVLLVGVIVDRVDRRRLLAASGIVRGAVFLAVACASLLVGDGPAAIGLLFLAAVAVGIGETFAETAAGALVPSVTTDATLERANGRLRAAQLLANEFVGPSLAGVLVALGVGLTFGGPAAVYVVAGLFALRLPVPGRAVARDVDAYSSRSPAHDGGDGQPDRVADERTDEGVATDGWWGQLREGVQFVAGNPALVRLVAITGAWNVASGLTYSVLVLHVVAPGPMGLGEPGYGLLLAASGVGGLVGSLVTGVIGRRLPFTATAGVGLTLGGLSLATPSVSTSPVVVGAALAIGGFAAVTVGVAIVSMRQRLTPDAMLGRVNAAFWTASAGLYPAGAMAGGLLAARLGLGAAFAAAGVAAATGLLALRELDVRPRTGGSVVPNRTRQRS